jgi:SRSO17 transposase
MNDQTEKTTADLLPQVMDLNAKLLTSAASTYAYNKINNILLMQILAKLEGRDLEEVRNNVEKYIAQFTDEFLKKSS